MKHHYLQLIIVSTLSLLILSSCWPEPTITVNPQTLEIPFEGSTDTIRIYSNYNWSAVSTSPAVSITPKTGSTDIPAVIVVDKNKDGIQREIVVTFSTFNYKSVSQANVVIKQGYEKPFISLTPSTLSARHTVDTLTAYILANNTWVSYCKNSMVTITPSEGNSDDKPKTLTIIVPRNNSNKEKQYIVTFSSSSAVTEDIIQSQITINQEREPDPLLNIEPRTITSDKKSESFIIKVSSNHRWGAVVSERITFINPPSGEPGTTDMSVSISENDTGKDLKHFVAFEVNSPISLIRDTLFIYQKAD